MIMVDTTVLVYATGADHPLRAPCRALVALVSSGRLRATTTTEVIQEFVHVRGRRRSRSDAAGLGRDYGLLLAPLVSVSTADLDAGLDLYEREGALGAFDAVLAAVARDRGALLVSADGAFAAVPDLEVLNPGATGFVEAVEALGA